MPGDTIFTGIVAALADLTATPTFYAVKSEWNEAKIGDAAHRLGVVEVQPDPAEAEVVEEYQAGDVEKVRHNFQIRLSRKHRDRAEAIKLLRQMADDVREVLRANGTNIGVSVVIHRSLRMNGPLRILTEEDEIWRKQGVARAQFSFSCKEYRAAVFV